MTTYNLAEIRSRFPALAETDEQGRPLIFFDGPAERKRRKASSTPWPIT